MRSTCILFLLTFGTFVFGQTEEKPQFIAADVHTSAKSQNQGFRPPIARGELLEAKNVPITDLISFAYNTVAPKVVGGPSWLEMDRFDVTAKFPAQTTQDQQRLMLRALLAERFALVVREETQPISNYALTSSGKHKLKAADGNGPPGCTPQSSSAPAGPGTLRIGLAGQDGGAPVQISLADGMIEYKCRNMTMAAFASGMRNMLIANLGVNPVLDQTELAGIWNFDLKYSIGLIGLPGANTGEQITIFEAVDKQLGLKLEEKQVPTTVIVVESLNRLPIANPAGTAEAIPSLSAPKEFEVAIIKPTPPDSKRSIFQMQAGGRLNTEGLPLSFQISRAFNQTYTAQLVGVPDWANTARFDIVAQLSSDAYQGLALDPDTIAAPMLALLKERFGLKYHVEPREIQAYDLAAGKPKMKKADPASRSWCKSPQQVPGAAPAPQGSQALICQNITMAQFAELLRGRSPELQVPPADATGLEGGWDFRLTYNPLIGLNLRPAGDPAAPAAGGPAPLSATPEPTMGVSIIEAVEKQLGLKLEKVKRTVDVTVIDHLDQTPTDN